MILSLLIISSIYIALAYTLVGNVPLTELNNDIRPLYTLSLSVGGQIFAYIIAGLEL